MPELKDHTTPASTYGPVNSNVGCGPLLPDIGQHSKSLRQLVFDYVRAVGDAARTDISRALNISPGSVTAITAELLAAGILREVEGTHKPESGRGRPSVALEVVPEAHRVIGIKISDERHSVVLADFAGNTLADSALATRPWRRSLSELLSEIETLVTDVLNQTGFSITDIGAIGVGLPGLVDFPTGQLRWSPLMAEENLDLKGAIEDRLGIPVLVDNDVNMLTLNELWFGAGRTKSDFAVVTIEGGVGMGLVLDHQLFRGIKGMGPELGHMKVQLDGALCRCGKRGCLEAYLADYALVREAATAMGRENRQLKAPEQMLSALYEQAKTGNEAALTIFRRAGRFLSLGLSNIIQLFDPDLIILSGERMRYDYLYADEVLAEMQSLTLEQSSKSCAVEIHAWGDLVWARGATALALAAVTESALDEARAS